jgi:hypothetical protein
MLRLFFTALALHIGLWFAAVAFDTKQSAVAGSYHHDWSINRESRFAYTPRPITRVRYERRQPVRSYPKPERYDNDNDEDREDYRYYRREENRDDRRDPRLCPVSERIVGLGTQHINKEGALHAAKKDWMERVRYNLGETFVDTTNSKGYFSRCSRVSIGEAMGQVFYRCEFHAFPCRAPLTQDKPEYTIQDKEESNK